MQSTDRSRRSAWILSSLALAGCHGSEDAFLAPGVNDLAAPTGTFWVEDGVVAAQIAEGGVDQNGDGDGDDLQLHVLDLKDGRRWTVPDVVLDATVGGGFVAFLVPEDGAAGDLNGDGDDADSVLHVLDARTGATWSAGLASDYEFSQDGALIAFGVSELAQGADLDGDGELAGVFAFAYEADLGRLTPLEVPIYSGTARVEGRRVVLQVEESVAGDLNGDGDELDPIAHVWDADTGVLLDTKRACDGVDIDGSLLALLVAESENGFADLNGNGTGEDSFAELHDLDTGSLRATTENDCVVQGVGGDLAVLMLDTPFQPGGTWVYDRLDGALIELHGLGSYYTKPASLCDRRFAFLVDENKAGADLDGDGLMIDTVLDTFDARTGQATCSARAAYSLPQIDERVAVFLGLSSPQVARPPTHTSLHALDLRSGAVRDLGIMATDFLLADERIVALTSEAWQGTDLNADQDLHDTIVQVHDLRSGRTFNTRLPYQAYFDESNGIELDGETLVLAVGGRLKAVRLQ